MKKKSLKFLITLGVMALFAWGCEQDFEPLLEEEKVGTITLVGYAQDTLQFFTQGDTLLNYNEEDYPNPNNYYINNIAVSKSFALAEGESESLKVIHWGTGEVLATYKSLFARPKQDTISFFSFGNEGYIEGVLDFEAGTPREGNVGYKFIFPKPNIYSNSGYTGALEAVIYGFNGEEIGRTDIGKEEMGTFIEFPFPNPQIIELQIVKAGTDEKYVDIDPLLLNVGKEGNSFMYVLYEKSDRNGNFNGLGTLGLGDYFHSFPQNEGGGTNALISVWKESFVNGIPSTWQIIDNTPYSILPAGSENDPYTWEAYTTNEGEVVARIHGVNSDFSGVRPNDYLITEAIDLSHLNADLTLELDVSFPADNQYGSYSDETLAVYAYTSSDTLSLINNGLLGNFSVDGNTTPFQKISFQLPETLKGKEFFIGVRYVEPHDILYFNEMYAEAGGAYFDTPYKTLLGVKFHYIVDGISAPSGFSLEA